VLIAEKTYGQRALCLGRVGQGDPGAVRYVEPMLWLTEVVVLQQVYIRQTSAGGKYTTIVHGHTQEPISNSSASSRHAHLVLRRGTTVESRVPVVAGKLNGSIQTSNRR
jgi:hypothetical protein